MCWENYLIHIKIDPDVIEMLARLNNANVSLDRLFSELKFTDEAAKSRARLKITQTLESKRITLI